MHDFPDKGLGKAIPYGIYDVFDNSGRVNVGVDHDTSAFTVATLRTWSDTIGKSRYPAADRLLIYGDGGGSDDQRFRAWKVGLAAFAADTGLPRRSATCRPEPASETRSNTDSSPRPS